LRWKKPRKIFVCAHSDLFHESVPDEWNDQIFAVMALAPQHTFQVLTTRPERMLAYLSRIGGESGLTVRCGCGARMTLNSVFCGDLNLEGVCFV